MALTLDAVSASTAWLCPAPSLGGISSSVSFSCTSFRRRCPTLSLRRSPRQRFAAGSIVCETKEAPAGVVDDSSFKKLVLEDSSEMPVLVDFWAPWCGPCRMLDPVIDNIAEKYKGRIKCFKVNTDECSKTATELGIRSIPTCMIFKRGERLDTVIGCVPETTLTGVIDKYIS